MRNQKYTWSLVWTKGVDKDKTWAMNDYLESDLFFSDGMQLVRTI